MRIIRSDGSTENTFSGSCPKCCDPNITRTTLDGQDFDEKGWFHINQFVCNAQGCGHKWTERQQVIQNRRYLR